ncbi:MAG TPA: DUF4062 domain-containing protein [Planctomycetota bacterium]|jgi:hypothetical protein
MPLKPVDVFISSTCYDLGDIRAELRRDLEAQKFIVRLSDDFDTGFGVDGTTNSIAQCLKNVEQCDVVVCILDRRYGPPLKWGTAPELSATHVEVRHAVAVRKPVFYFLRSQTHRDCEQMKSPDYKPKWIEPGNPERQKALNSFVAEIANLPQQEEKSNWVDTFDTSVDLKPKVLKRVLTSFPAHAGTLAADPARLPRLVMQPLSRTPQNFRGVLKNFGVGPAFHVVAGVVSASCLTDAGQHNFSGIGESGEENREWQIPPACLSAKRGVWYCEYENRYGDCYRVEVPMEQQPQSWSFGRDKIYVKAGASAEGTLRTASGIVWQPIS